MTTGTRSWAGVATSMLAAALAVAGLGLAWKTPGDRLLLAPPLTSAAVMAVCFVAAFALAEGALLHVELHRQAYSFSLAGLPLLLGLFFLDVHLLLLARLLGALLVMAYQRLPVLKVFYNLASYLFELSLLGFAMHRILGAGSQLTLTIAATCYLLVTLADLLMSSAVLLVISLHQGRVSLREAAESFLPAIGLGAISTGAAIAVSELLAAGAIGVVLVVGAVASSALMYRGYLGLRWRHQSLTLVHDFVAQGVGATTLEELAEALLTRTQRLFNAAQVRLVVRRDGLSVDLRIAEDGSFSTRTMSPPVELDWLLSRALANREPIVIGRNVRDRGMRQWLVDNDARDAMIVALANLDAQCVLLVRDRLGETATYTSHDLALLQTLAGHIVIALRSAHLVDRLRIEATHDGLTGLANRTLLADLINAELARAGNLEPGGGDPLQPAVMLLDLDKFKEVNDALGHHVGDALLRIVGARLSSCVPAGATVARLGGDEFAVLLPATTQPETAARQAASTVLAALTSPIALDEAVVSTHASIGIALAGTQPGSAAMTSADLLRHADTAMYAAKGGEHAVVVYTEELDHGRAQRLALLADLHLALDRDELELSYQPQLDLRTDEVVSVEALVRWRHPQLGLLSPDAFIPLAESSGLIEQLSRQVLGMALRQCRAWRDAGIDLTIAVNLSPYNVNNPDLVDDVGTALVAAGVPASRLVLEITESSVMGDPRRTVPTLQRLADIGVTLSLDDFGTGYSSLAYLQRLPVSEVKIDKSFVTGMAGTEGDADSAAASQVLVRSILALGSSLGLRVVAEGIEDLEVLELLRGLGCDLAQGYYIDRPLTAAGITARMGAAATRRRPVRLSILTG